jgi:hypothetical protein
MMSAAASANAGAVVSVRGSVLDIHFGPQIRKRLTT